MKLKNIVPWGRNLEEYRSMFLLTNKDLNKKILGCGDGPSSFNVEASELGADVVSIDPIYQFSKEQISLRIDEIASEVMAEVRNNRANFVWNNISTPNDLEAIRMSAMKLFLEDYPNKRYVYEMLPTLSFSDKHFDLALSSHFLFLYSEHLDFEFHFASILEMLRVADEVRIFPLVTLRNERSPYVDDIIEMLGIEGFKAEIVKTNYEFQQGGDKMMRICV